MLDPKIKRFRLAATMADHSPFSLGRVLGPLQDMADEDPRLELVLPPFRSDGQVDLGWPWLGQCDALLLVNAVWDLHAAMGALASLMGKPVWCDYGDDPFTVQYRNPGYDSFAARAAIMQIVTSCVKGANITSVATDMVRQSFPKELQEQICLVPEACRWQPSTEKRQKVVSWRGAAGHDEDVEPFLQAIREVARMKEFEDWKWVLFGCPPKTLLLTLSEALGESLYEPADGSPHVFKRLLESPFWPTPFHQNLAWRNQCPYIHIVPLPSNPFNLGKPPNAWCEATSVGAVTLGPDFPEWRPCKGMVGYISPDHFRHQLIGLMQSFNDGAMHPGAVASQAEVYPKWTLREANKTRWAILNRLAKASKTVAWQE